MSGWLIVDDPGKMLLFGFFSVLDAESSLILRFSGSIFNTQLFKTKHGHMLFSSMT